MADKVTYFEIRQLWLSNQIDYQTYIRLLKENGYYL